MPASCVRAQNMCTIPPRDGVKTPKGRTFDFSNSEANESERLAQFSESKVITDVTERKQLRAGDQYDPFSLIKSSESISSFKKHPMKRVPRPVRLEKTGFEIHFTNVWFLSRFITPMGKIMTRRQTGFSVKKQKKLAQAIKRARNVGFLPFLFRYHEGPLETLEGEENHNPLSAPLSNQQQPRSKFG